MASLEELRTERLKKLAALRAAGLNPYPNKMKREVDLATALKQFSKLSARKKPLVLAGRIRSRRGQGGVIFFDLDDGTARLQALLKKDEVEKEVFSRFQDWIDIGDFVSVSGHLFTTTRGEKTILVNDWQILTKSLRPLPDKWHGLSDVEERFRRRYLDSLMSPEVKKRFLLRSKTITAIRSFLNQADFLEVETPILQPLAGGATATPFVTHHQALNLELYLRVAPELYLKKMLVGGFPRVYELGQNFRNEGIDVVHNPEFTSLEVYESFATVEKGRQLVTKLLQAVLEEITGELAISYQGQKINFAGEIPTITFADLLKKYTLINNLNLNEKELELKASQFGINLEPKTSREKILDAIYKKICRPRLIQPIFIIDYPLAFSPLAKKREDNPELIDRFQLVAGGLELVNGFAELNDPLEQAARFVEQEKQRAAGDQEAQIKDEEFVEALEYGLPPTCGWGLGIDRLIMLLTDTNNIREVVFFPILKPR